MEKKRFLSTAQKIGIVLFLLLGIGCAFALNIAQNARALIPETVNIPASGLSDSVFDAQNGVYQADAEFPIAYSLNHIGFVVDVPDCPEAAIGNGKFWKVTDGFYVYITEGKRSEMTDNIFSEVAPVLLPDAGDENISGELIHSERGYLNGQEYTYAVFSVKCSVDGKTKDAYVVGYLYEDSESGFSAFFSCVTEEISSTALTNAQIIAQKEATLMHADTTDTN